MKILYVHNEYKKISGEEQAAKAIAKLLSENGHEIFWYTKKSEDIFKTRLGKLKSFFSGIYSFHSKKEIKKLLSIEKPDLLIVQNIYPLISISIFSEIKKAGIPLIMRTPNYRLFCPSGLFFSKNQICEKCTGFGKEIHCIINNCEENIFKSFSYALRNTIARISKQILKHVDIFIVQTEFQKQKFIDFGINPNKLLILPGLTELNSNTTFTIGETVSFIGRVSKEKGIVDFIKAAEMLPEIPFLVVGDYSSLPNIIEKVPLNVTFLGFQTGAELEQIYINSRIVIISSNWYEGFPNTIIKAMALGKPIISTKIGAMTSIVKNNVTGLFYEPHNYQQLANQINILYNDLEMCKTYGENAKNDVNRNYNRKSIYLQLINIYNQAIEKKTKIN